jgi:hypothetical protein
MRYSSLFLSVGLRNRQLLQATFCRRADFRADRLNEILTVDFRTGLLSAIGREIGRAIIQAFFFSFDVAEQHPRCQSKQGYSGYDDLFEKFFVHGCVEIAGFEKARRRQFSPEFS